MDGAAPNPLDVPLKETHTQHPVKTQMPVLSPLSRALQHLLGGHIHNQPKLGGGVHEPGTLGCYPHPGQTSGHLPPCAENTSGHVCRPHARRAWQEDRPHRQWLPKGPANGGLEGSRLDLQGPLMVP